MATERTVRIADRVVGHARPCFIVAEVGINHNGDLNLAKRLIALARDKGCDGVKFQKRTVDVVYSPEELGRPRESPFGSTVGDLKRGLEFGFTQYQEIDRYCRELDIMWFASPWDERSVDFLEQFNPPCYKIPSARLTDLGLVQYARKTGRPLIISTGMSTMEEIQEAVDVTDEDKLVLLHCTSTYPSAEKELNLGVIPQLMEAFDCPVGYSGHEVGVVTSVMAVVLGACVVERHVTLDRAMWGSDQAASLEPHGLELLTKYIRTWPIALGDGRKRVYDSEKPILEKLRRIGCFEV
jgi:N-acetylneuraminate synthase